MRRNQLGLLVAVSLAVAACGESSGEGTGGSGGSGGSGPVDQCANDADQAIFDDDQIDVDAIVATCPLPTCGGPLGTIVGGDTSEQARNALGDCIAQCLSDMTGLSDGCAGCYGSLTSCSVSFCFSPCFDDAGGEACASCSLENCGGFEECRGF